MVSVLREKFAHFNLTFSIGGQISFDVSNCFCSSCFHLMSLYLSKVFWAGFPSRLGQDLLLEIPGRVSRNSLFWGQDLQGYLQRLVSLVIFLNNTSSTSGCLIEIMFVVSFYISREEMTMKYMSRRGPRVTQVSAFLFCLLVLSVNQ